MFALLLISWESLNSQGVAAQRAGQYLEARRLFAEALPLADAAGRPRILNNLASAEYLADAYGEAEVHYKQAMELWQSKIDMAKTRNNLAVLYRQQARYALAEQYARDSIAMAPTAPALHNLAEIQRLQGHYRQAEQLLALAAMTPEDTVVQAQILQSQASLHHDRNEPALAEPIHRRAVSLLEEELGPEHPQTLGALSNLAQTLLALKKWVETESILARVLETMKRPLGPNHPRVAVAANNLAQLYRLEQRYAEAEPLYREALRIWESSLGPTHPDTAKALCNLGGLFFEQGKLRGAEQLYNRALKISESSLGSGHPQTRETLANLERLYLASRRSTEAAAIKSLR